MCRWKSGNTWSLCFFFCVFDLVYSFLLRILKFLINVATQMRANSKVRFSKCLNSAEVLWTVGVIALLIYLLLPHKWSLTIVRRPLPSMQKMFNLLIVIDNYRLIYNILPCFRRKALWMWRLWAEIPAEWSPAVPYPHTHRREAVFLLLLWQDFPGESSQGQAHGDTHWSEAISLWRLREEFPYRQTSQEALIHTPSSERKWRRSCLCIFR